jgi:hypothetical protein
MLRQYLVFLLSRVIPVTCNERAKVSRLVENSIKCRVSV